MCYNSLNKDKVKGSHMILKHANLIKSQLAKTEGQTWRLVAILERNGKPIVVTSNIMNKSHPDVIKYNRHWGVHAEMRCIKKAPWGLTEGGTMYVYRWSNGSYRLAKPCSMCMDFLLAAGIKKVLYSNNQEELEELRI
jgi:tRNA(Arg) A34 adenosine deaminase TadA